MKVNKLLLLALPLFLFGCANLPNINISLGEKESQATEFDENGCPVEPGELKSNNVKKIDIDGKIIEESSRVRKGKYIGYSFEGKKGQELDFSTETDLCLWLFSPNNELIDGLKLQEDGFYTLQITVPKGSTSFDLTIGLDASIPTASNPISISSSNPSPPSSSPPQNSSQGNGSTTINIPTSKPSQSQSSSLSKNDAIQLVVNWQKAKQSIFAYPYDSQLGSQLLTGKAYRDNINKPGDESSREWLQNNGAYYTYQAQEINSVESFNNSGNQAFLEVVATEQRTLCNKGRPSSDNNTSLDKRRVRYDLQNENGSWKIADYKTVNVIQRSSNPSPAC
ncbi:MULTISPECIES: ARC6/PARC6 family protein [Spirulina sp. CCY15215]|uniref:ARC6/PARC6 family protein n=1 Tax=Spirulina sp. CCY15215 TaxID=2767591 RepID=UPI0019510621|nr:ARC6/PARC6 family protein [Spirulina major]